MTDQPQHLAPVLEITHQRGEPPVVTPTARMSFDRPTLISLPGIDAIEQRCAVQFADRRILDLLGDGVYDNNVRHYAAYYQSPDLPESRHARLIAQYYAKGRDSRAPEVADALAADLVETHFRPAIMDVRDLSGTAREDAVKKTAAMFGNINLVAFSYGTLVLRHLHERLANCLKEKGFAEKEVPQLMRRAKALSFGEMAHWKYPPQEWHIQSIHLTSHDDELIKPMIATHSHDFTKEPVRLEKLAPSMLLVHSFLPKHGSHIEDVPGAEEAGNIVERTNPSGHAAVIHTRHRFTDKQGVLFTTTMMQSALRNMLHASSEQRIIESPEQLLDVAPMRAGQPDYLAHASGYGYAARVSALPIHTSIIGK